MFYILVVCNHWSVTLNTMIVCNVLYITITDGNIAISNINRANGDKLI